VRAAADLPYRWMATSHWQLTRFSARVRLGDHALMIASLAAAVGFTALATGGSPLAGRLATVPATAGLLALPERRRRPVAVLVAVFAVVFVEKIASPHAYQVATFLAVMVATYSLGAHAPRRVLALRSIRLGITVVCLNALGARCREADSLRSVILGSRVRRRMRVIAGRSGGSPWSTSRARRLPAAR